MSPLLILLAAAAPAAAPPAAAEPVEPQAWVTNEDYPLAALRAGESGAVGVQVEVDAAGAVTGCTVTASSGSATLDRATCDLVRMRGRFRPARDPKGRAVASRWTTRFRWDIPATVSAERPDGVLPAGGLLATYELDPDGRITDCRAETRGWTPPGAKERACTAVEQAPFFPFLKAQGSRYRLVRVLFDLSVDEKEAARFAQPEGTPIVKRTVEATLSKAGERLSCRTVASVGEDPFGSGDLCETFGGKSAPDPDAGAVAAHRVVVDLVMAGTPR